MVSGVPVANGGTGATTAANARSNLGTNNAANITTGTLPAARLPFKYAYGSTSINGSSATYVDYSSAGFTLVGRQRRDQGAQQNDQRMLYRSRRQLQHKP